MFGCVWYQLTSLSSSPESRLMSSIWSIKSSHTE